MKDEQFHEFWEKPSRTKDQRVLDFNFRPEFGLGDGPAASSSAGFPDSWCPDELGFCLRLRAHVDSFRNRILRSES